VQLGLQQFGNVTVTGFVVMCRQQHPSGGSGAFKAPRSEGKRL
jgi:hypothetical protein